MLPISMPRFKSNIFYYNSPKIKLFLRKNTKYSSTGGSAPRPPCLRRVGLCPQTPSLWRLEASPPDYHWLSAAEGSAPRPQYSPPIANFWLRAWLWLLLHHFNVFGYNSTSIVMLVCFYCYLSSVIFFLIYLFVTAKQLQQVVLKKLSGLGGETSNQ